MADWIYGIVAVLLFGTVILQVTPEGTYQKYVRLFLGALLMLIVTGPLYSWLGISEKTRLSFEQGSLSSWMEVTSFGSTGETWQESDRWETMMKKQVNQKQEIWVRQILESTAQEYGFWYLDHEVQWNAEKSWPQRLTLWVEKPVEGDGYVSEDVLGMATDPNEEIEKISMVSPIVSEIGKSSETKRYIEDEVYYEPSELRSLHQALQVIWQLEEGKIVLYWQR